MRHPQMAAAYQSAVTFSLAAAHVAPAVGSRMAAASLHGLEAEVEMMRPRMREHVLTSSCVCL